MSMDRVKTLAEDVIVPLRLQIGEARVRDFEACIENLDIPDKSAEALRNLIGYCNIRVLGDIQVASLGSDDWLSRLERLSHACRRELKRHGADR